MNVEVGNKGEQGYWPRLVLFDLDGTLIDSAPDIRTSVNTLLAEENLAALTLEDARSMIGNGIGKLVERAFAKRGVTLEGTRHAAMVDRMMTIYADHLTLDTSLMEGAAETVAAFKRVGVATAVVTNKPESFTRKILEHFCLGDDVSVVVGGDTCEARKPDPTMLLYATEQAGVAPSASLMVGDSPADIDAAKAARMASVAVRGGYTNVPADDLGADVVIDTLKALPAAIETLKEPA